MIRVCSRARQGDVMHLQASPPIQDGRHKSISLHKGNQNIPGSDDVIWSQQGPGGGAKMLTSCPYRLLLLKQQQASAVNHDAPPLQNLIETKILRDEAAVNLKEKRHESYTAAGH